MTSFIALALWGLTLAFVHQHDHSHKGNEGEALANLEWKAGLGIICGCLLLPLSMTIFANCVTTDTLKDKAFRIRFGTLY
jgi:hypothetical protein